MNRKLWNKDFVLLLQGNAVSTIGDVMYSIAIGYWVYQTTGSSALMGIMSSISMFITMFFSPLNALDDYIYILSLLDKNVNTCFTFFEIGKYTESFEYKMVKEALTPFIRCFFGELPYNILKIYKIYYCNARKFVIY